MSGQHEQLKQSNVDKDNEIAKLKKHIEDIQFHNTQLTKRVAILQTDLNEAKVLSAQTDGQVSNAQHSTPITLSADMYEVFNSELESKIAENAKLHMQIEEQQEKYQHLLNELEAELNKLRTEKDEQVKRLESLIEQERHNTTMEKDEKNLLRTKVIEYLAELENRKVKEGKQISIEIPLNKDSNDEVMSKFGTIINRADETERDIVGARVECKILENRLDIAHKSVAKLRNSNDSLKSVIRNYETQLVTISEHLAGMNEKFIKQEEELQSLRM